MTHRPTSHAFGDLPIGAEFWWGGFTLDRCNWGRKRSSRTADYRPRLSGELSSWTDWGYWRQSETVYLANSEADRREGEQ
jgi:hypothetical protein